MSLPYIGNPDFRGYIAKVAPEFLGFVGNDGGINTDKLNKAGGVESNYARQSLTPQGAVDVINKLITKFQSYSNSSNSSSGSSGGGGSSGGSGANTAKQVAQYDQSIGNTQSAINRLGSQEKSGLTGINSSYQNALNQLLLSKNQGQTAYNTNKQQAATDYVGAKNTIGANAGSTLSGLQRLLGSRGAGGGSAYQISAPGAVAREATIQRSGASNTFGANNQSLDTNWNNFLTGYQNEVNSAKTQKSQQERELTNKIGTSRATLLQNLATLKGQRAQAAGGNAVGAAQPYLDQANRILDQLSSYQVKPIAYHTTAYVAPDLGSYSTPKSTPTYQGQPAQNDYFSPYLSALLGKKQLAGA